MPIDVVKVRMQFSGSNAGVEYKGSIDAARQIARNEGVGALFKGLKPALLRQATYGSMRYGLYTPIRNFIGVDPDVPKSEIPIVQKIAAGAGAGAIASFLANPTDLIKVRMQVEGMGGSASTQQYRGLSDAFKTIVRNEGVAGLWKGVGPTCGRATVLAAAELSSYDEIKCRFLKAQWFEEGLPLHVATSLVAGFIATACASPFDVAKSRVMGQPVDAHGKGRLYKGMIDCLVKTVIREGPQTLWKGFVPNFGRIGPHVVINFVVIEQMKKHFG